MTFYAVDDELLLLENMERALKAAAPEAAVQCFSSDSAALETLEANAEKPNVVFLDIEMPGMGGMELAQRIKLLSPKTAIIFVTGFSQYAAEAYARHANGYVMKPVTVERLREELELLNMTILPPARL